MRPTFEVADIINDVWPQINALKLNTWQLRTLNALRECRTASLGGHIDACDNCGHIAISYNSCRNRHCPKCQGQLREQWIGARQAGLLPVQYFHVVFTIPDSINRLCLYEPAKLYNILFKTAWEVMQAFSKDEKFLGAQTGMITILHTWGQNLSLHPHLHCIVPAGGITKAKRWTHSKYAEKEQKPFLFPVKAMRTRYRAKFVAALRREFPQESKTFFKKLFEKRWVIYAKQPFGGPEEIIEYLGRYTHKIAISNHRIVDTEADMVTFSYKDYRDAAKKKQMTLAKEEFVRRFALHILPKNFVRIRHYGILASGNKKKTREIVYSGTSTPAAEVSIPAVRFTCQKPLYKCPCCKTGNMHLIERFDERGPPEKWVIKIAAQKQVKSNTTS